MNMQDIAPLARSIRNNISRVIVGKEELIDLTLAALLARGHVLLEDVPGTGKTMLARALAKSLDCGFSRIQFTPDLLPADITGTRVYQPKSGDFLFQPGPVFTNICLADEINRATPRTQSAMLECMEERQVTEGGVTRALDAPFLVVATQNPIEIQGTFPLPEAQLDRFLMRLKPGYPTTEEGVGILDRFIDAEPLAELTPVCAGADIVAAQRALPQAEVSQPVRAYIVALCERTRAYEQVQLGVSPRGTLALLRAAQAYCLIRGRAFVTPDDIQTLAVPVLAHRVVVRGLYGRQGAAEDIIRQALSDVPVPTERVE